MGTYNERQSQEDVDLDGSERQLGHETCLRYGVDPGVAASTSGFGLGGGLSRFAASRVGLANELQARWRVTNDTSSTAMQRQHLWPVRQSPFRVNRPLNVSQPSPVVIRSNRAAEAQRRESSMVSVPWSAPNTQAVEGAVSRTKERTGASTQTISGHAPPPVPEAASTQSLPSEPAVTEHFGRDIKIAEESRRPISRLTLPDDGQPEGEALPSSEGFYDTESAFSGQHRRSAIPSAFSRSPRSGEDDMACTPPGSVVPSNVASFADPADSGPSHTVESSENITAVLRSIAPYVQQPILSRTARRRSEVQPAAPQSSPRPSGSKRDAFTHDSSHKAFMNPQLGHAAVQAVATGASLGDGMLVPQGLTSQAVATLPAGRTGFESALQAEAHGTSHATQLLGLQNRMSNYSSSTPPVQQIPNISFSRANLADPYILEQQPPNIFSSPDVILPSTLRTSQLDALSRVVDDRSTVTLEAKDIALKQSFPGQREPETSTFVELNFSPREFQQYAPSSLASSTIDLSRTPTNKTPAFTPESGLPDSGTRWIGAPTAVTNLEPLSKQDGMLRIRSHRTVSPATMLPATSYLQPHHASGRGAAISQQSAQANTVSIASPEPELTEPTKLGGSASPTLGGSPPITRQLSVDPFPRASGGHASVMKASSTSVHSDLLETKSSLATAVISGIGLSATTKFHDRRNSSAPIMQPALTTIQHRSPFAPGRTRLKDAEVPAEGVSGISHVVQAEEPRKGRPSEAIHRSPGSPSALAGSSGRQTVSETQQTTFSFGDIFVADGDRAYAGAAHQSVVDERPLSGYPARPGFVQRASSVSGSFSRAAEPRSESILPAAAASNADGVGAPALNVGRLADQVYNLLVRRLSSERQRRGA